MRSLLVSVVLAACSERTVPIGQDPVGQDVRYEHTHFIDGALERAVRRTLKKPSGTPGTDELAEIIVLRAGSEGVVSLQGIEALVA